MPRKFLLSPIRVSIVVAIITCILCSSHCSLAEEPRATKQMVEVKLWVVEVSKTKIRNLGFDWDSVTAQAGAAATDETKFLGFLEALDQNGIAQIHARPMIATKSGRKATLDINPHLKIEVTPTVNDAEHIDIAYYVDVATAHDEQHADQHRRVVSACTTEVKTGVIQLLSETSIQRRTAKGALTQSKLLVLAQATVTKP